MKPTVAGAIGATYFDGCQTWLCMGGTDWVTEIPLEQPPIWDR